MKKYLKRYLSLTYTGILEGLTFRVGYLVTILGNVIYLTISYFLWKAIYRSSGGIVNGMTFQDTLVYVVLASALFNLMEMFIVWEMGRDVQTGKIILNLLKPTNYQLYMFFLVSGCFITSFFLTFLPTFILFTYLQMVQLYWGRTYYFS